MYEIGSIFSGGGGIDLGFERAGFKVRWFIEKNEFCRKVLKKNWSRTTIYVDAEKVNYSKLERVDGIVGGFPCQDISNAGTRAGIKGKRSSLWRYFHKAIRILQPRFAFIENVSAISYRGLSSVLADLAEIGYDAEWHCLPASTIGASHQRDRLFIIAYSNKIRCHNGQDLVKEMENKNIRFRSPEKIEQWKRWRELRSIKNDKMAMRQAAKSLGIEPLISGDSHGFSAAMDRVGTLGNAVVPDVAELFAHSIKLSI